MPFTWKPIFKETSVKLLEHEHRQDELCDLLRGLADRGLPAGNFTDKLKDGTRPPLSVIDPFTFFGAFNRKQTTANRNAILQGMREYFGLEAPLPSDFDGVPVMNPQRAWFFSYGEDRKRNDIPRLWKLARQVIEDGRTGVDSELFDRCLAIRGVGIASLTMGLFWLRPDEFLPIDGTMKGAIGGRFHPWPTDWASYTALLDRARAELHPEFDELSLQAYTNPEGLQHRRYWAGGFLMGDHDARSEFEEARAWWLGWPRDTNDEYGRRAWRRLVQVKTGDLLAIKGYGGTHDLVVHRLAEVRAVDPGHARLQLAWMERPLFSGKAPRGTGAGNWRDALLEVTRPDVIQTIFAPRADAPPEPQDEPVWGESNVLLYGPPGTGKTYAVQHDWLRDEDDAPVPHCFVTFHPSFGYEDFVEGIRPRVEDGDVVYRMEDGLFKEGAEAALLLTGYSEGMTSFCNLTPEERRGWLDEAPDYVFVIDEINRGNVARIFGELITLIEPTKRLGGQDEPVVLLPGSRGPFGVPANLRIVGTMNTADRSIDSLDLALRRRFVFEECPPRPDLLDFEVEEIHIGSMLAAINDRIERLLDRDHRIGHTPFIDLDADSELEDLVEVFAGQVVPLLQEYFFDDWRRIGLVLGQGFVHRVNEGAGLMTFPEAEELSADLPRRYALTDAKDWAVETFQALYAS